MEKVLTRATWQDLGYETMCLSLPVGLGGRNGDGHKSVWVNGKGLLKPSSQLAHRVVYEIKVGPIGGSKVLHRCDNCGCVNVDHLFLGTQADNVRDMESKGRSFHPVGESTGHAKINQETVREIRRMRSEGVSTRKIASRLGVSRGIVCGVVSGRSWSWME